MTVKSNETRNEENLKKKSMVCMFQERKLLQGT